MMDEHWALKHEAVSDLGDPSLVSLRPLIYPFTFTYSVAAVMGTRPLPHINIAPFGFQFLIYRPAKRSHKTEPHHKCG